MELRTDDVTLHLEIDGDDDALEAMAEAMLQLDASVLDPVFDGSIGAVFDPERELPVPAILIAGDPAMPDTLVREAHLARLAEHSPASRPGWPTVVAT